MLPPTDADLPVLDLLSLADRERLLRSVCRGLRHDLCNALQVLQIRTADMDLEEAEAKEMVDWAVAVVDRSVRILGEITAPAPAEPEPVLVADLLHQVVEWQSYQSRLPPVPVTVELPPGLGPVAGPPHDLQFAVLSLITLLKRVADATPLRPIWIRGRAADGGAVELTLTHEGAAPLTMPEHGIPHDPEEPGTSAAVLRHVLEKRGGNFVMEAGADRQRFVLTLPRWQPRR